MKAFTISKHFQKNNLLFKLDKTESIIRKMANPCMKDQVSNSPNEENTTVLSEHNKPQVDITDLSINLSTEIQLSDSYDSFNLELKLGLENVNVIENTTNKYPTLEKAFELLKLYIWRYTDDFPPIHNIDQSNYNDVAGAALVFLLKGKKAIVLAEQEVNTALKKFNIWYKQYCKISKYAIKWQQVMHKIETKKLSKSQKDIIEGFSKNYAKREKFIHKAYNRNGTIFNLIKKLNYLAAYQQSASIFCMFNNHHVLEDFAKNRPQISMVRDLFYQLEWQIEKDDDVRKHLKNLKLI